MAIAGAAASEEFDRSRPLWEFTLVEDLEDGRAALVMKLHHSLTDGVGGVAARPVPVRPRSRSDPGGAGAGASAEDRDRVRQPDTGSASLTGRRSIRRPPHRGIAALGPMMHHVVRHPIAGVGNAVKTTLSICRMMAPVNTTMSPVMRRRGVARHFEVAEMQLHDLKQAAAAAGGKVNDGFIAGVTGGLRRYHERHAAPVDQLRVTLPISTRTAEDPLGGNRLTLIRFAVPVAESDPAARIRKLSRLCRAAQAERSLRYTDGIAATLNLLPRRVVGGILKHIDFLASNIPGLTFPVYLAGVPVERLVAFGPTTGTAANFTLMSYDGICCVGINVDSEAVPDPHVLIECVREGFEEVLSLAGAHEPVELPLRDRPAAGTAATAVAISAARRSRPPPRKVRKRSA